MQHKKALFKTDYGKLQTLGIVFTGAAITTGLAPLLTQQD